MDLDSVPNISEHIGITAICGDEGTCKTTMAISYPKPIFHLDVDVGGFRRAAWRLPEGMKVLELPSDADLEKTDITGVDVITKSYPKPLQLEKMMGVISEGTPSTRKVNVPKREVGMKQLWQAIITDFAFVCQRPEIRTIVVDSNTMFYNIGHKTRLQELQEIQEYKWRTDKSTKGQAIPEDEYRERLQPVEYGTVYDRMKAVYHTARVYTKELVLTHYPTDEYGTIVNEKGNMVEGKTGNKIMDGYKDTGKLSDLVVWLRVDESMQPSDPKNPNSQKTAVRVPMAKIRKCGIQGMGLKAVGMEIEASYDSLINLMRLMRGGSG